MKLPIIQSVFMMLDTNDNVIMINNKMTWWSYAGAKSALKSYLNHYCATSRPDLRRETLNNGLIFVNRKLVGEILHDEILSYEIRIHGELYRRITFDEIITLILDKSIIKIVEIDLRDIKNYEIQNS